jgi:hypothetical protein
MQYPDIIALIDSRLALLQQVRELVAPSCASSRSPLAKPRVRKEAASRTVIQSEVIPANFLENGAAPRLPQPLRLPPAPRRERVSRTKSTVAPKAVSALTGNVPNVPVAISADQVRAAEARKQSVATQPPPGDELASFNTEQIARKWLQDLKAATA